MKKHFSPITVFIVEDDPIYMRLVKYVFELNPDFNIRFFTTGQECINNLHLKPSIISLDFNLPDMKGDQVLQKIKNYNKDISVVILSGQQNIEVAVKLLKSGAYDYIVKNEETKDRLHLAIQRLASNISLKQEVEVLKDELEDRYDFSKSIIGNSKPMQKLFKMIDKAIKTNISVSITGETGSGKEIIARSIHYHSNRRKGSLIAVNVSAIPKDLLESDLFGHEKGAFTGADARKLGKFELADKGTLFLDEVAELDINLQSKLLRALQEREFTRVGGTETVKFDARIVVATHRDLLQEVELGNFREDLYYRLLGLPIEVPPLRERGNDILLLMRHFLKDFCKLNNLGKMTFDKTAKKKLMSYSYPGNVRELKSIVELAAVMADDIIISENDINFNSPRRATAFLSYEYSLKEYNRKIVDHFLEKYDNDILLVAKKLSIGKSTIYRMLKENNSN